MYGCYSLYCDKLVSLCPLFLSVFSQALTRASHVSVCPMNPPKSCLSPCDGDSLPLNRSFSHLSLLSFSFTVSPFPCFHPVVFVTLPLCGSFCHLPPPSFHAYVFPCPVPLSWHPADALKDRVPPPPTLPSPLFDVFCCLPFFCPIIYIVFSVLSISLFPITFSFHLLFSSTLPLLSHSCSLKTTSLFSCTAI